MHLRVRCPTQVQVNTTDVQYCLQKSGFMSTQEDSMHAPPALRRRMHDQNLGGTETQAGVLFTTDRLRSIDARATRLKAQYEDVQR